MDAAVALVEAYLRSNGYFTVTEFPIFEATEGGVRPVTDIDMLAVRLPGAGTTMSDSPERLFAPDPYLLSKADDKVDLIIAEVKEGRAELNRGAMDPKTLLTALRRFASVSSEAGEEIVEDLLSTGHAELPGRNARVRVIVFAGRPSKRPSSRYRVILLRHCLERLFAIADAHMPLLKSSQQKNPIVSLLGIMAKIGMTPSKSGDEHDL